MMSAPAIDWGRVRSGDDCILIHGFSADPDTGGAPAGLEWLGYVPHGSQIEDRNGNRFRVMGHGSVQGSVVIRDRYRRMYQADIDQYVRRI